MLRDLLRGEGIAIGRERVTPMMASGWGLRRSIAGHACPNPQMGTRSFPICCAARRSAVEPSVAMDITYIPMARGFVYLTAVVDWFIGGPCLVGVDQHGG